MGKLHRAKLDRTPVRFFLTELANRFIYTLPTVIAELGYTAGIAVCGGFDGDPSWDEVSLTSAPFFYSN